jgi:hypothetical protein
LHGKIPEYWYDFLGNAVAGIAAVAGAAAWFSLINPIYGLIMIVFGSMRSFAYMIGWLLPKHQTPWAEALTGLFAYTGLLICLLIQT